LYIRGLHIHTGSEIKEVAVFMQVAEVFSDLVPKFPELEFLDMGGGFKVAYKDNDPVTNIEELGKEIALFQKNLETKHQRKTRMKLLQILMIQKSNLMNLMTLNLMILTLKQKLNSSSSKTVRFIFLAPPLQLTS
jgi:arginine decarboxylase-like protein